MRSFLENKFAAVAILIVFTVAFSFSAGNGVSPMASGRLITEMEPVLIAEDHGPSMPPDPWEKEVDHGPSMPPDPWEPSLAPSMTPDLLDPEVDHGPSMPPDPWEPEFDPTAPINGAPVLMAADHGPSMPPDPWERQVQHGPSMPPDPWEVG